MDVKRKRKDFQDKNDIEEETFEESQESVVHEPSKVQEDEKPVDKIAKIPTLHST